MTTTTINTPMESSGSQTTFVASTATSTSTSATPIKIIDLALSSPKTFEATNNSKLKKKRSAEFFKKLHWIMVTTHVSRSDVF